MKIPTDKLKHAAIGSLVALFALAFWTLLAAAGVAPLSGAPAAAALASLVAGITKEGADWIDNKTAGMQVHGVEFWDAFATAIPGFVVGVVVQFLL